MSSWKPSAPPKPANVPQVKYYTCEEVAKAMKCTVDTIWRYIRHQELTAVRMGKGRGYRITDDDLRAFNERRRTVPLEASQGSAGQ